MSTLFRKVEGEQAVISEAGLFRQCDLYTRMGSLYAKLGSGFIRLYANGSTSRPSVRLDSLEWEGALYSDLLRRLRVEAGERFRTLQVSNEGQLQIADARAS